MSNYRDELASKLLIALYANPKVEPEDYVHNAIVAINAADAFVTALHEDDKPRGNLGWDYTTG